MVTRNISHLDFDKINQVFDDLNGEVFLIKFKCFIKAILKINGSNFETEQHSLF
jgi:hypothetical protein